MSNIDTSEHVLSCTNKNQQSSAQRKNRMSEVIPNNKSNLDENVNVTKHNLLCPNKKESNQNAVNVQKITKHHSMKASPGND